MGNGSPWVVFGSRLLSPFPVGHARKETREVGRSRAKAAPLQSGARLSQALTESWILAPDSYFLRSLFSFAAILNFGELRSMGASIDMWLTANGQLRTENGKPLTR